MISRSVQIRFAARALLGASCLATVVGCGGSDHPETVRVGGLVTYKGAPLTNGTVVFNPVDSKTGRPAHGAISSDGSFTLSTYQENDGARPGEYHVSVVSYADGGSGGLEKDKDLGLNITDESAIPEKYNDPKTSGITVTVDAGNSQTDLTLELKDE